MLNLIFKYSFFAIVAMLANLATQYLWLDFYGGRFALYSAIALGTIVGLAIKYFLDKKFIFFYFSDGVGDNFKKFILYSVMGIVTTLIFWGTEIGFDAAFNFSFAKYIGATIGLTIGYIIKYNLDKRFVFRKTI